VFQVKKNSFSNVTKMLLISALTIGGLSACGYNKGTRTNVYDGARPYTTDGTKSYITDGVKPYSTTDGTRPYGTTNYNAEKIVADRVVNEAMTVNGVTKASAVVRGNDIAIGIDGKSGTDSKTLENQVYNTVKNKETGYNIYVTSDPTIYTRIRTLYTNMTNPNTLTPGHPVRDFTRDIGDLIRDIGRTVTAPLR
jgi:YhcN/YlaJ family sporulation lipoprotein